ncbi:hypothetical protein NDU88_001063 [Pleurodeles waltl]|uniref:Uncharacterized protein n=1 Tax=Pleurodeles waltl TaxID=8319 RepID=A0AAV7R9Y5_PLEWA|nr:hypothetical protein NDU88_001063 [Pleurodeles waltl]
MQMQRDPDAATSTCGSPSHKYAMYRRARAGGAHTPAQLARTCRFNEKGGWGPGRLNVRRERDVNRARRVTPGSGRLQSRHGRAWRARSCGDRTPTSRWAADSAQCGSAREAGPPASRSPGRWGIYCSRRATRQRPAPGP